MIEPRSSHVYKYIGNYVTVSLDRVAWNREKYFWKVAGRRKAKLSWLAFNASCRWSSYSFQASHENHFTRIFSQLQLDIWSVAHDCHPKCKNDVTYKRSCAPITTCLVPICSYFASSFGVDDATRSTSCSSYATTSAFSFKLTPYEYLFVIDFSGTEMVM